MIKLLKILGGQDIVTVTYDLDGRTQNITFHEETSKEQRAWVLYRLSVGEEENTCGLSDCVDRINQKKDPKKRATLIEVEPDLSFERFWEDYGYKIGKKKMAENKWKSMDDMERIKALKYIKTYNYFLMENRNIQKLYPSSYLNRAEWNN